MRLEAGRLEAGRLEAGTRLVVATGNAGKAAEFALMLAPYGLDCVASGTLGLAEPEEDADDFAGNARIKAVAAAGASGAWAVADDSGLSVAGLEWGPGVRSARFAAEAGGYPQAMKAIIAASRTNDHAVFACAICLASPAGLTATYLGFCHGHIAAAPSGVGGFGYDPIFVPIGAVESFAAMPKAAKAACSHRGRALRQFIAAHCGPVT